jgi:mercuric ion transport protein
MMNIRSAKSGKGTALLSYFSLFTSVGTLLCCALPSLFVLFGLGALVASTLSFLPWLVTLSRHKQLTFAISGLLIALGFVNIYIVAPRLKTAEACKPGDSACADASRFSKIVLWVSAGIYSVGFFVAYVLGPILSRLDQ